MSYGNDCTSTNTRAIVDCRRIGAIVELLWRLRLCHDAYAQYRVHCPVHAGHGSGRRSRLDCGDASLCANRLGPRCMGRTCRSHPTADAQSLRVVGVRSFHGRDRARHGLSTVTCTAASRRKRRQVRPIYGDTRRSRAARLRPGDGEARSFALISCRTAALPAVRPSTTVAELLHRAPQLRLPADTTCTRVDYCDHKRTGSRPRRCPGSRGEVIPMKFRRLSHALACTSLLSIAAIPSAACAQHISRIIVFGDSYADTGNALRLAGINPASTQVYTT